MSVALVVLSQDTLSVVLVVLSAGPIRWLNVFLNGSWLAVGPLSPFPELGDLETRQWVY